MRTATEILSEIERLQKEYAEKTNPLLSVNSIEDGWVVFNDRRIYKMYPDLGARVYIQQDTYSNTAEYSYEIYDTLVKNDEEEWVDGDEGFESLEDCIGALNNTLASLKRRKYVLHVEVDLLSVDNESALESLEDYFDDKCPEWFPVDPI